MPVAHGTSHEDPALPESFDLDAIFRHLPYRRPIPVLSTLPMVRMGLDLISSHKPGKPLRVGILERLYKRRPLWALDLLRRRAICHGAFASEA